MAKTTDKTTKRKALPKLPYGQGSMSYRPDGKVMYRKRFGNPKKEYSVYADTPKEAMEKMAELEKNVDKKNKSKEKITLYEAILEWAKNYKKGDIKATAYETLEKTIHNYIGKYAIGSVQLSAIDSDMLQKHINMLNVEEHYSHSTIKKCYNAFTEFFEHLFVSKKIEYNIMLPVKMIREENVIKKTKDIEYLKPDDIKKFIKEATIIIEAEGKMKYQYGLCLAANVYLGMRGGELIALKWKDIDFENDTIYVHDNLQLVNNPAFDTSKKDEMKLKGINKKVYVTQSLKTNQNRIIHMNASAKKYLLMQKQYSKFISPNDYVCCTKDGKHSAITYLSDNIEKIEISANTELKEKGTHVIRHTCASLYFRANVRIELIASLLGHSVDVCRKTYIKFEEEQKKLAVKQITDYDAVEFDFENNKVA